MNLRRLPEYVSVAARSTIVLYTLFSFPCLWAAAGGSISGTVSDPNARTVEGATVTAIDSSTNIRRSVRTSPDGIYSFLDLAVGTYNVEVECPGFRTYRRTRLVVDANSALRADVSLTLGEITETVTVAAAVSRIEAVDTQLGEVMAGTKIEAVPLNGRSFTDLLALQPGVAPMTTITGTAIQAAGAVTLAPSGSLNPAHISINGQREYANGFTVNDADVVERFTMGAAVVPDLDSIAEFRVLTETSTQNMGITAADVSTSSQSPGRIRFTARRSIFCETRTSTRETSFLPNARSIDRTSLAVCWVDPWSAIRYFSSLTTREHGRRRESTQA